MNPLRILRTILIPLVFALPLAACSAAATTSSSAPAATASATSASQSPSVTPTTASASASPSASPTPTPTSTVKSFSMAQVKTHASAASCWSAVDGKVYDLTKWIGRHPGGRGRIVAMCGKDGTATYRGEHGKERGPSNDLKRYLIGPLA
jgi:cytochrome b involved in lipid metabolism